MKVFFTTNSDDGNMKKMLRKFKRDLRPVLSRASTLTSLSLNQKYGQENRSAVARIVCV